MGHSHKTVLLLTPDAALGLEAATRLSAAGYIVITNGSADDGPDLIVRDWRDERWVQPGSVPVLTLDLTIVQGIDLLDVVRRVVGRHITRVASTGPRSPSVDAPMWPLPAPIEERRATALRPPAPRFRWRN